MANKKNGTNKSQAARELLTQKPDMTVKEVVNTLATRGVIISPNQVYYIKGNLNAGDKRRKKVIEAARAAASTNRDPLTLIREIKALAATCGGIAKLKELVEALAE